MSNSGFAPSRGFEYVYGVTADVAGRTNTSHCSSGDSNRVLLLGQRAGSVCLVSVQLWRYYAGAIEWLTAEPTGLCTEFAFFDHWLVIVNPIGVTSTTLTQDCLSQAVEAWNGSVEVTPMPVVLGIVLGTICGGLAGLLVGLLVLRLRAAYLALFTLGCSEIIKAIISAEINVTRGQAGLELPPLFSDGILFFGVSFS